MTNYRTILFTLVLVLTTAHSAMAEVGKTLWLKDSSKPGTWKPEDGVCLYQDSALTTCGKIKEVRAGSLGVVVTEQTKEIQPKKSIRIVKDTRRPVTTEEVSHKMQTSNAKTVNLALGLTAGTQYFYPNAHIQLALNRNWSLGLMPMFAKYTDGGTSDITAYGAFLTLTYYYTHFAFKGVQFEAGIGMDSITLKSTAVTTLEESHTPIAGKLTIGWAGKALWDLGLDIGVAAGVQYVGWEGTALTSNFKGLLPLINAYLAYNF